jgi:hypothetical protein
MNYYSIEFPNHTNIIVKIKKPSTTRSVALGLSTASGLIGFGGTIFNPKQFILINSIISPDERQKKLAKELDEVLF